MSDHLPSCDVCETGRSKYGIEYLVCRRCGCHFITLLEHDGRCFDCRGGR